MGKSIDRNYVRCWKPFSVWYCRNRNALIWILMLLNEHNRSIWKFCLCYLKPFSMLIICCQISSNNVFSIYHNKYLTVIKSASVEVANFTLYKYVLLTYMAVSKSKKVNGNFFLKKWYWNFSAIFSIHKLKEYLLRCKWK